MAKGQNITRRNFIALSSFAGGAAGLGLVGCSPQAQKKEDTKSGAGSVGASSLPASWDHECDVLIIGGGGAGSSAAMTAARSGANVIVLESQQTTNFSSTAVCKGNFCVIGSDEMSEAGIEDSPELFLEDALAFGYEDDAVPGNREDAIMVYAENSYDSYKELKDLGVEFSAPYFQAGHSVHRVHKVDNGKMQQLLTEAAEKEGAEFLYNVEFTSLIVGDEGTVVGAVAQDNGKEIFVKALKAVVLATGSFVRNSAMVDDCVPGLSKVELTTAAGATGGGHLAAMQLGGAMWGHALLYGTESLSVDPEGGFSECVSQGGIAVDKNGSRYVAEDSYWGSLRTRMLISRGLHPDYDQYVSYYILDQTAYDLAVEEGAKGSNLGLNEQNIAHMIKADSIEELAEVINAPNLPSTIEQYNKDISGGGDKAFGRTTNYGAGTEAAEPLDNPPFYAWANKMVLEYAPTTGFLANGDCQVLDQYGEPIGGGRLFATGELTLRSIVGNHYLVGTSIGSCTTLGMVIGRNAAALDSWE